MNITQHMMQAFANRHILGRCNYMIEAATAAMVGEAPEWCPVDSDEAESAWAMMRVCRAEVEIEKRDAAEYRVVGSTIAHTRMNDAKLAVSFEGGPDAARELAEQVRETADALHDERDTKPEDSSEWDRLDYAGDLLNEYADALESAADDPEEPEVYQAFYVSDWLAHFLSDRYDGEGVMRTDGGMVWLRQCCGQAAWMDPCIEAAAREWYGDAETGNRAREWTRYAYALDQSAVPLLDAARALLADPYLADPINNDRMGPLRDALARIESLARGEA